MNNTTEMTEKEIIEANIKTSTKLAEVAQKCGFSKETLRHRMKSLAIDGSKFKIGQPKGFRKTAKLG
jgi:DNA-binding NtrC family response regulator